MRRSIIALVLAATGTLCLASNAAFAEHWRLPDGIDNPMPRYYDYRSPRVFYFDEAPIAFDAYGYAHRTALASHLPPSRISLRHPYPRPTSLRVRP